MKIDIQDIDKDKLFFTSDTHFFHNNIIKFCDRPFDNTLEMNKILIDLWNQKVPSDGIIFHLGDVSLGSSKGGIGSILNKLNGTKHLIVGNHEKDVLGKAWVRDLWETVSDIAEIKILDDEITYGKQHIVMCHYPMLTWNASHRGSWQLFGHMHGRLDKRELRPMQMDVGVDTWDYSPYSYEEIKEKITKQYLK